VDLLAHGLGHHPDAFPVEADLDDADRITGATRFLDGVEHCGDVP